METQDLEPIKTKSNNKKILITILFLLVITVVLTILYLYLKYPTTSPINSASYFINRLKQPHAHMQKDVIGFLPYWRLDDTKYLRFDLVSEVIFFSLSADENGQIIKIVNSETDPGWRWWSSPTIQNLIAKTQITGGKFGLTVAMQKNKTLESFLDNPSAQKTLINNLIRIVQSAKIDALNLDFEYDGKPDDKYKSEFTNFAKELTSTFKTRSPQTELSIDFFPLSIQKPRLYDVASLTPLFDKVIVMSYDYYSGSSDLAGPVAPIFGHIASPSATQTSYSERKNPSGDEANLEQGKENPDPQDGGIYFFDVNTTYSDYLKVVPKEKLIMGVPYYGWDYPVEDNTVALSKVLPQNDQNGYSEVISYGRARTNTDLKPENCQWDDTAKATWCAYTDSNKIQRKVWLEDNKSIEIKFDFAKTNNLGGIAIWTLGYDKDYPDLWNLIKNYFTK